MKKIVSLVLAVMFVLCGIAMAEEATLTMGTNVAFPPYEYYEGTEPVGIDVEIAKAIAEMLNMTLVVEDMDFNAVIPAVTEGKVDIGMAGITVTEERKASVNFTNTYATATQVVIVTEDSDILSVDDLFAEGANHTVGVQIGTTGDLYSTWDIEDEGLGTVSRYNTGADAVEALKTGKVDCVVIDCEPAKAFVAANEGLMILDTEYALEEYAIAVSLENEDLLEDINEALAQLIEDGTVDSIVNKYISGGEVAEEAAEETDAE